MVADVATCSGTGAGARPARAALFDALLGELAAVGGHGEGVGDDEDADEPGEGDPDVGADRLLCEEVADRVDDGRYRLVLGEGAHGVGNVVEYDHNYTGSHSRDVVELALAVGHRLRLTPAQLRHLEFGALLHDVGKIAVPKEIINKPGPLNDAEWAIMRRHTIEGQRMLDSVGGVLTRVGEIVRASHEDYDGTGYPDGLAGDAIPIEARICSACDAFSAMTTDRAYRNAMSEPEALAELQRCAGTQFDPRVVVALETLLRTSRPEATRIDTMEVAHV